jgi:hypothetical protein
MEGLQQTDDLSGWERLSLSNKTIRSFPQFNLHDIRSLHAAVDTTVTLPYAGNDVYRTIRTSCATETTATTRRHRSSKSCTHRCQTLTRLQKTFEI